MTDIQYILAGISLAGLIYYAWELAGAAAMYLINTFDAWSQNRTYKPIKENKND